MMVYNDSVFKNGYTSLAEVDGTHSDMGMDFGILHMEAGDTFQAREAEKECAFLLMNGTLEYSWDNHTKKVRRSSLLDESPFVLHVPVNTEIFLRAETSVEVCVQRVYNSAVFEPVFYEGDAIRSQRFGEGTMQDTSTRIVRTVFDAHNAPLSEMVLGEVVNYPGKWSSYPPHTHPHTEIYHYRFPTASQGFGYGELGDQVFKIKHQSTLMITPNLTHSQTAAPGYPMYYLWMIPHLPHDKFGPDSRNFKDEHKWLLDASATIWPKNT